MDKLVPDRNKLVLRSLVIAKVSTLVSDLLVITKSVMCKLHVEYILTTCHVAPKPPKKEKKKKLFYSLSPKPDVSKFPNSISSLISWLKQWWQERVLSGVVLDKMTFNETVVLLLNIHVPYSFHILMKQGAFFFLIALHVWGCWCHMGWS